MIPLRLLLFIWLALLVGFAGLGLLACAEWSTLFEFRRQAQAFHADSKLVVFSELGVKPSIHDPSDDREFETYEFEAEGIRQEFQSHHPIGLPADGRVRVGVDPRRHPSQQDVIRSWHASQGRLEIAVPIAGLDSVSAVYAGLHGHSPGRDVLKASLVSLAALLAGVAGLVLRHRYLVAAGRDPQRRPGGFRRPLITERERANIRILGVVQAVLGAAVLLGGGFLCRDLPMDPAADMMVWMAAAYTILVGVTLLVGGVGILIRKRWALPCMKASGVLLLICFPVGTVVGVWTLSAHTRLTARRR